MVHILARALAGLAVAVVPPLASAQEAPTGGVAVELNAAAETEGGCTLSFVIENEGQATIGQAVYETVLFGTDGQVNRLTLLDFGALPAGRPRVRQFTLNGTPCDRIGRILFNGAETCEAETGDACTEALTLTSRTEIEVIG